MFVRGELALRYSDFPWRLRWRAKRQYLVALDKKTGENKWKTDRTTNFNDIDPKLYAGLYFLERNPDGTPA